VQDASTASLVWTLTMMAERPEILAKVRKRGVSVSTRAFQRGSAVHPCACTAC
jgi:hypothetical protein